jgi:ankyrin repeat protein
MNLLLNRGANAASADNDRAQVLQYAIYGGNARAASFLLARGASLTSEDRWGKRALHDACIDGPFWLIRLMIKRGADVSARDTWGKTALHRVLDRLDSDIVDLLIDAKLDSGLDCRAK